MTTSAMTYHQTPNFGGMIIFLGLIGLALLALPPVIGRTHAEAHEEANLIRECYNNGNLLQRWVRIDPAAGLQRDHCLVQLPDGKVGDRIVQFCKNVGWLEITAFVIGDGELKTAIDYLKSKACTQVFP